MGLGGGRGDTRLVLGMCTGKCCIEAVGAVQLLFVCIGVYFCSTACESVE